MRIEIPDKIARDAKLYDDDGKEINLPVTEIRILPIKAGKLVKAILKVEGVSLGLECEAEIKEVPGQCQN